jgi:hypothetical protein
MSSCQIKMKNKHNKNTKQKINKNTGDEFVPGRGLK